MAVWLLVLLSSLITHCWLRTTHTRSLWPHHKVVMATSQSRHGHITAHQVFPPPIPDTATYLTRRRAHQKENTSKPLTQSQGHKQPTHSGFLLRVGDFAEVTENDLGEYIFVAKYPTAFWEKKVGL